MKREHLGELLHRRRALLFLCKCVERGKVPPFVFRKLAHYLVFLLEVRQPRLQTLFIRIGKRSQAPVEPRGVFRFKAEHRQGVGRIPPSPQLAITEIRSEVVALLHVEHVSAHAYVHPVGFAVVFFQARERPFLLGVPGFRRLRKLLFWAPVGRRRCGWLIISFFGAGTTTSVLGPGSVSPVLHAHLGNTVVTHDSRPPRGRSRSAVGFSFSFSFTATGSRARVFSASAAAAEKKMGKEQKDSGVEEERGQSAGARSGLKRLFRVVPAGRGGVFQRHARRARRGC
mmetsp:Transcript_20929/g.52889  ORF Transcript_20929/g.52889 Transcript_20929/m.52889 type:complete len:285 (+) Transcript_20929:329-1183(+)